MLLDILLGGGTVAQKVQQLVFTLLAVVIALSFHEFSHALVSYWCGDKTAKAEGRLSLNPLRHIDPFGFLTLTLFGFGWAKPVNIRPSNYKHPRLGCALTAAAGPLSNFILAFISTFFYALCAIKYSFEGSAVYYNCALLFKLIFSYNVGLGLFNLIPIPPLDGSKVIGEFLPYKAQRAYYSIERYGFIIAIAVVFILDFFNVFGIIQFKITDWFLSIWEPVLKLILFR